MTNRFDDGSITVTVLDLAKGIHRWIILYTDSQRIEVLRQLQRWINNDALDFGGSDAERMLMKMAVDEN